MKKDILNRDDIENAIKAFYDKVVKDDHIGFIFTDIANVNWVKPLPINRLINSQHR